MRHKELIAQLTSIGLLDHEAVVYIAGLKCGPSLLAPLARTAEISRSTAYEVVEQLAKRGLFTISTSQKRTIYSATSPTQLLKEILDREYRIRAIIPELEQMMTDDVDIAPTKSINLPLDMK